MRGIFRRPFDYTVRVRHWIGTKRVALFDASIELSVATTAPLTTAILLAGTASLAVATTADLTTGGSPLEGTASLTVSAEAPLTTSVQCAGTATLAVTSTAPLTTAITLAGTNTLTLTASAPLTTSSLYAGTASLTVSATAPLTTAIQCAATPLLTLTATAPLTTAIQCAATSSLTLTATAPPPSSPVMAGTASLTLTATGGILKFPDAVVLDTFNRANEGPPPSSSWVNSLNGGWYVNVNAGYPFIPSTASASSWNTSFPANQEVYATMAASVPATHLFLYARMQTANSYASDHYEMTVVTVPGSPNDVLRLYKSLSGVFTQLGADIALGAELAIGTRYGLRCEGSTLSAWAGTTLAGTRTDTAITGAGYIGMGNGTNSGPAQWDNFGGGALFDPTILGTSTLTISTSAPLTTAIRLAGSATDSLVATGPLTTAIRMAGASSLTVTTAGQIPYLQGTSLLSLVTDGSFTLLMPISATPTLTLTGTGALTTNILVTGVTTMAVTSQGSITTGKPVFGTVPMALTTAATISTAPHLATVTALTLTTFGALESLGFPATFPATAVLDNFNRADQGPPPSASWVTCSGSGWRVLSNLCAPFGGAAQHGATWNNSFGSIQEVYFQIANTPPASSGYVACFARLQSPTNLNSDHYEVRAHLISGTNNDVLRLFKVIGGVASQIGIDIALGVDFAPTGGDQIGLRCEGTTITVWFNGALKRTVTDSSLNVPGYIGIYNAANVGTAMADNFGGGAGVTVGSGGGGGAGTSLGRGPVWPYRHGLVTV
jgi:hypothetical protein